MNRFKAVCASQLGPSLGTQLWGATEDGHVFSTVQTSANAPWEEWSESEWLNAPAKIIALTAAPDQNGRQSLWALTADHVLHCKSQGPGEKWSDPTARWFNAPKLTCICAAIAFSGWNRWGRYLWGVGEDGQLYWTYEDLQKGLNPWVNWSVFDAPQTIDAPQKIIALAAAPALNGYMSLWALTEDHALHCKPQSVSKLAQDWDPWSDKEVSWHNSPKLTGICATLLGGSRGRAVWGIGEDKQLYWTYETREGWASSGWDPFDSTGEPKDISSLCAAQQNQGRVMLWALSQDNSLYNNTTTASGDWTGWDVGGTRLLTYGIIDDIVRILSGSLYDQGVTYLRTSGNKFTLLDTPRLWGADSTAPNGGSPASKNFCLEITDVIGSAERQLDIALLFNTDIQISAGWIFRGFPDGKFQDAIAKGLLKLSQKKGSKPDIRILLGAPQTVSLINDLVRLLSLPLPSTSTIINGLLKSLPKQMQACCRKL